MAAEAHRRQLKIVGVLGQEGFCLNKFSWPFVVPPAATAGGRAKPERSSKAHVILHCTQCVLYVYVGKSVRRWTAAGRGDLPTLIHLSVLLGERRLLRLAQF